MGMGQVTLGLRSLLVKLAVFFILASLLAWALGGTLWPRAQSADLDSVEFVGLRWFWRVSIGGEERGGAQWRLMTQRGNSSEPVDDRAWTEVAGPVVSEGRIYYGGRLGGRGGGQWRIESRVNLGDPVVHPVPDRLALEQQLARLASSLPLQEEGTISRQRQLVLDPPESVAARSGSGRESE